jgi:hypothetical protein
VLDRVLALLDSRHLSRVGNLRTLISVAGAVALMLIGVVLAAIKLFTDTGWVPLLFIGLALVVVFVLVAGGVRSKQHSQVQLTVMNFAWEDLPDGSVTFQAAVRALNNGPPTRLNRWGLSAQSGDSRQDAVHLRNLPRFQGRPPLEPLDAETATKPLATGEEREGRVSFTFPHTTSGAMLATELTLSVHDEKGKESATLIDLDALRDVHESTVEQ